MTPKSVMAYKVGKELIRKAITDTQDKVFKEFTTAYTAGNIFLNVARAIIFVPTKSLTDIVIY